MAQLGEESDVIERIKNKTTYHGECWVFNGKLTGRGYGNIWYKRKMVRINRLICHLFHEADLDKNDWTANHTKECQYTACWNPEHLYVGTQMDNVRDSIEKGTFHYGTENIRNKNPYTTNFNFGKK